MAKLFLMMGAPGSGKSTWVKKNIQEPADVYISRDEIRFSLLKEGEDYFAHEKEVFSTFINKMNEALSNKSIKRVFLDASHLDRASRERVINRVSEKIESLNVIYLDTPFEECIRRNNNRNGRANVPYDVILEMHNKIEIPTSKEGVDKVYIVNENEEIIKILDLTNKQDEEKFIY